jgi:hypothetical protein
MEKARKYVAKRIKLLDEFIDLVLDGKKVSTIRYGFVFITDVLMPLVSERRELIVKILSIDYSKCYGDLDEKDARNDGFNSLNDLKRQINKIYPYINEKDPITIINFKKVD